MRSKPDRLITFVRKRRNPTHGMVPIRYPQILPLRHPALFRALVALRRPFEMDLHGAWHVCRLYYRRVRQDLGAAHIEFPARLADHDRRAGFGRTDSLRQESAHGVDADFPAHVSPRHRPNHPDETRCRRQLAVPGTGPAVRRFERSGSPWGRSSGPRGRWTLTRRAIDRFFKGFEGGTRKAERCNGKVRNLRILLEDRRMMNGDGRPGGSGWRCRRYCAQRGKKNPDTPYGMPGFR